VRAGCAALNTEEDDEWVSGVRLSGSFGRRERFFLFYIKVHLQDNPSILILEALLSKQINAMFSY
jgi:hypothetical protein